MENKKKLFSKLLKVMNEVGKVQKSGYNAFQKYNYVTEADLIEATRQALIDNGIFVSTSIKSMNKEGEITSVILEHTFSCAETGESHVVQSAGQGHDKLDKGVYKAITGAMKYFISKNFMISGEDDPENDSVSTTPPDTNKKNTPTSVANKAATNTVKINNNNKKFNKPINSTPVVTTPVSDDVVAEY